MCKSSMKFKNYFKVNKAFKPIKKSQNFLKNKPDCPNICKKDLIVTCYVLCNIFSYTHIVFVFSSGEFLYLSDVFSPFFFSEGFCYLWRASFWSFVCFLTIFVLPFLYQNFVHQKFSTSESFSEFPDQNFLHQHQNQWEFL